MLLSTVNPEAAEAIGNVKKVGVGNLVVYHARSGYMRDKRSSFPALVLSQHLDGSLNLLVFMEREDFATEEHVQYRSHNQANHCWSVVEDAPGSSSGMILAEGPPDQSDTINQLVARVEALEAKRGPGRPPKTQAA